VSPPEIRNGLRRTLFLAFFGRAKVLLNLLQNLLQEFSAYCTGTAFCSTGLGKLRLASQLATLKGVKKSFFKLFLLHEYYLGVSSDPINLIWSHG
jgi:hypothetical protein